MASAASDTAPANQTNGPVAGEVSRAVVRAFAQHLGRGPTKARTVIGPGLVTVVLNDTLTSFERTLLASDGPAPVVEVRRRLHEAIRDDLAAAVEQIVGHPVLAVMSDHRPDLDVCVVVFLLEREPDAVAR